jgi:hypothetical protein
MIHPQQPPHIGRRKLTPAEVSYLPWPRVSGGEAASWATAQGGAEKLLQNATISQTAEAIANRHGVDRVTLHRDAQFAKALDRIAERSQQSAGPSSRPARAGAKVCALGLAAGPKNWLTR